VVVGLCSWRLKQSMWLCRPTLTVGEGARKSPCFVDWPSAAKPVDVHVYDILFRLNMLVLQGSVVGILAFVNGPGKHGFLSRDPI